MPDAKDDNDPDGSPLSCASFRHPLNSERMVSIMLDCKSSSSSVAFLGISCPLPLGCVKSKRLSSAISSAKALRLPELSRTALCWRCCSSPPSLPSTGDELMLEPDSIQIKRPELPASEFPPAAFSGSKCLLESCFSLRLPPGELSLSDDFLLSNTGRLRSEDPRSIRAWLSEDPLEIRRRTVGLVGPPPGALADELSEDSWPLNLFMQALHKSGMLQFDAAFCN
mmetsp:Transcript_27402/g.44143  ORF Transcript_27402/g.44143 Transcript_27402/m.44143 type:complete len:225 (-) Transcript_27402:107-781(-)